MATTTQRAALKTFHGPTMAQALAEVKKDLGPEAVILHTRTYRVGGVMGMGARNMVEITASADAGVVRPKRVRPRSEGSYDAGLPGTERSQAAVAIAPAASETGFIPTPPWFQPTGRQAPEPIVVARQATPKPLDTPQETPAPPRPAPTRREGRDVEPKPISRQSAPASDVAESPRPTPKPVEAKPDPVVTPIPPSRLEATKVEPAPTTPGAQAALEEELAAIRRLVGQVLQSSRRAEARAAAPAGPVHADAPSVSTGPLFDHYMKLLDSGVSTEIGDELVSAVRDELSAGELADPAATRDALLRQLARRIPVVSETQPPTRRPDGRPHVLALVGPTGVGKTTTVAKLAATCKLRYGRKVGLVTADTYRIAAVEQLRTYADIVGLPLKVALSPQDMAAAIDNLSDCEIVLIDTAGRSQHDAARLDELREFLDAAQPDASHLVLSLAAAESVILAAAERFAPLHPTRLILSKLDEAVDFGVVANIAGRVRLPISHVTTGQEVPDHIEHASADRLARLVLEGGAAWKVLAGAR